MIKNTNFDIIRLIFIIEMFYGIRVAADILDGSSRIFYFPHLYLGLRSMTRALDRLNEERENRERQLIRIVSLIHLYEFNLMLPLSAEFLSNSHPEELVIAIQLQEHCHDRSNSSKINRHDPCVHEVSTSDCMLCQTIFVQSLITTVI